MTCSSQTKCDSARRRFAVCLGAGREGRTAAGVRDLDSREAILTLAVADQHGEIQTAVRDVRERPARIEGQRRQYREDGIGEVRRPRRLLLVVQFGIIETDGYPRAATRRTEFRQAVIALGQQLLDLPADRDKLRRRDSYRRVPASADPAST